jgi:hypothetical protein
MYKIQNIETPAAEFVALFKSWLDAPALAVAKGSIKPAPRIAPDAVIQYAMSRDKNGHALVARFMLGVDCAALVTVSHTADVEIVQPRAEDSSKYGNPFCSVTDDMHNRGALLQMAAAIAAGCSAHVAAAVY